MATRNQQIRPRSTRIRSRTITTSNRTSCNTTLIVRKRSIIYLPIRIGNCVGATPLFIRFKVLCSENIMNSVFGNIPYYLFTYTIKWQYAFICVCERVSVSYLFKSEFRHVREHAVFVPTREPTIFVYISGRGLGKKARRPRKFFDVKTSTRSFYGYAQRPYDTIEAKRAIYYILRSVIKYWEAPAVALYLDECASKITIRVVNIVRVFG